MQVTAFTLSPTAVRILGSLAEKELTVPDTYYDELPSRVGDIDEDIESLKRLGILVDRDEEGYLLQIFTKPVEDRPTVFFEILQRKGCKASARGISKRCLCL